MGLLQYTSNEMFSSTELVRKNKNIFDKLNKNEIEKAIVLRDGKPAVILLDFAYYEEIMKEYLSLKEGNSKPKESIKKEIPKEEVHENRFSQDEEINGNDEFSFDSDLTKQKPEPLKEFWD